MKLAVIIDPIEQLNPKKDSTIALLRAAQSKGLDLYFATQADLYVEQGYAQGLVSQITTSEDDRSWYTIKQTQPLPLSELDIILMRKDPPFDINYIYTSYLLELAEKQGSLVVNKPQGLRDANEKYFTTHFSQFSPSTFIGQNAEQLKSFWQTHQDVIYKPLDGMGGKDIFRVDSAGKNLNVIIDILTKNQTTPVMAQKYIPEIKQQGDRRILILDDYVVPYVLARIPQGDDERGNLAKGAVGEVKPITEQEMKMAQAIIPTLQEKGLIFVGLDAIGDYITEINVTSPTCIEEIQQATQLKIAERLIDKLIQFVENSSS